MKKQPNEKEIIRIFSRVLGISELDDVATIDKNLVFKADMLVASTDMPPQMTLRQVARKSVVACASDLAAKGAKPLAAMISLGLPKGITKTYVKELASGFKAASREFDVNIVGGDTNAAGELVIDCSMIGTVTMTSRVPKRSGARPGDAVITSGMFGYSAAGLEVLLKAAKARGSFKATAVEAVLEPKPRQAFGIALAKYLSSSIDSSDGLATSIYEIATQSKVDIEVELNSVMADGVKEFADANGLNAYELVFHGGEEYEIVGTIPRSLLSRTRTVAKNLGFDLYVIGSVKEGAGKVMVGEQLLEDRGYLHFGN
jgi:thiamine-monophosphate kinase